MSTLLVSTLSSWVISLVSSSLGLNLELRFYPYWTVPPWTVPFPNTSVQTHLRRNVRTLRTRHPICWVVFRSENHGTSRRTTRPFFILLRSFGLFSTPVLLSTPLFSSSVTKRRLYGVFWSNTLGRRFTS